MAQGQTTEIVGATAHRDVVGVAIRKVDEAAPAARARGAAPKEFQAVPSKTDG